LKENLLWVRHFQTIEELRQALLEFRETYNATWLIERHGFMSPADFRQRQLQPVAGGIGFNSGSHQLQALQQG
jgi:hypothetical protein